MGGAFVLNGTVFDGPGLQNEKFYKFFHRMEWSSFSTHFLIDLFLNVEYIAEKIFSP